MQEDSTSDDWEPSRDTDGVKSCEQEADDPNYSSLDYHSDMLHVNKPRPKPRQPP
jgi:hypothetical protein